MENVMTKDWKDRYFDEKFENIAANFRGIHKELENNTKVTNRLGDRVTKLETSVTGFTDSHVKKTGFDAKSIGIVIGTAAGIILSAYLTFKGVLGG